MQNYKYKKIKKKNLLTLQLEVLYIKKFIGKNSIDQALRKKQLPIVNNFIAYSTYYLIHSSSNNSAIKNLNYFRCGSNDVKTSIFDNLQKKLYVNFSRRSQKVTNNCNEFSDMFIFVLLYISNYTALKLLHVQEL